MRASSKEGMMRCLGTATARSSYTLKEGSLRRADPIIGKRFEAGMSGFRSNCEDGYGDATAGVKQPGSSQVKISQVPQAPS